MREIKFRAWDKEDKKWNFIGKNVLDLAVWYSKSEGQDNPFWETDGELQQFTGLKDKNGKEIYEGDIVKVIEEGFKESGMKDWRSKIGRINFQDYRWNFVCEESACWLGSYRKRIEIIGNIYENPELLTHPPL